MASVRGDENSIPNHFPWPLPSAFLLNSPRYLSPSSPGPVRRGRMPVFLSPIDLFHGIHSISCTVTVKEELYCYITSEILLLSCDTTPRPQAEAQDQARAYLEKKLLYSKFESVFLS